MILRVRRGLEANRTQFTPSLGEPIFTTDTKRLYVGDGVTPGGIPVDTGGGGGEGGDGVDAVHRADKNNPHEVTKAQVGLGNVPNTDFTSAVAANTAKRSYPTADQNKLAGIEAEATANASNAQLRDRLTHTGTQPISSVTGLQSALDAKQVAGDYATSSDVATSLNSKVDGVTGATDNTLPRFDGTSGKTLQPSGVTVSDDDDIGTTGFIESTLIIGSPSVAADEIVEYYEDEGISIDGVLVKDGLVSGRDVALDGYKLDSIEPGAEVNDTHAIEDLTDVTIDTPVVGNVIKYDGSGWVNAPDAGGGAGVTDHGLLTGLGDDDHTQYHNDTRGDARYYTKTQVDTQLDGKSPMSHNHPATDLTATGRTNANFLRGDNTWAVPTNTTYSEMSEAEITAGTASNLRTITGRRIGFLKAWVTSAISALTKSDIGLGNVDNTSDATKKSDIMQTLYPIGTIYTNRTDSTNPSTLFGFGTWVAITDKMIMARGSTYTADGGSATHTHGLGGGRAAINATGGEFHLSRSTSTSFSYNVKSNLSGLAASSGSTNGSAVLIGNTDSSSNIPPNIVAYVWERTA